MGNLVDWFFVKLKDRYDTENLDEMAELIKNPIERKLFKILTINNDFSLFHILDSGEISDYLETIEESFKEENGVDVWSVLDNRYRGPCLRQTVRKLFFDTAFILKNKYDSEKTNRFFCVGDNIITEEQWETTISDEQKFNNLTFDSLKESGYEVYT